MRCWATSEIWTVGHWNLSVEEFLRPLRDTQIQLLVDVRSLPGSRRSPQFNREAMERWLPDAGITYTHMADLGGRRRSQDVDPDVNAGWNNESFKRYADYTLDDSYSDAITALDNLALAQRTVIMCGEPVPWRCHRSIIADTLVSRNWTVTHLLHGAPPVNHVLGKWGAKPVVGDDGRVFYPAQTPSQQ